jgi:predicted Zn-dependent peptidase
MGFRASKLGNGIRVLSEKQPDTCALSLGIWIDSGSGDEEKRLCGVSHLIEHMVFKGTENFNAFQIVSLPEAVGAEINAFTSREHTCFYTMGLATDAELCIKILSDLVARATFPAEEYDKERLVVTQEIRSGEDSPDEHIFDVFFEKAYKGNSIGRPILGTFRSLGNISRAKLHQYYRFRYVGENIIVAAAGNIEHDQLLQLADKFLGHLPSGQRTIKPKPTVMKPFTQVITRDSEHVHMLVGIPAPRFNDHWRAEGAVMSTIAGGGMSSRFYQEIREKQGLAYSVYSYQHIQNDTSVEFLYSSTEPKKLKKLLKTLTTEMHKVSSLGVTQDEVRMAKTQIKGQLLLANEDLEFRMNSLAVNDLMLGRNRSMDEILEEIDKVSVERVNEYAKIFWEPQNMGTLLLGPVKEREIEGLL